MICNNQPRLPLLTPELIRDLRIRLDALLQRGCSYLQRGDPVTLHDMLDLYELSARLELLIETLDARRRIHMDVHTSHDEDKEDL
jgi:hypothetical protein